MEFEKNGCTSSRWICANDQLNIDIFSKYYYNIAICECFVVKCIAAMFPMFDIVLSSWFDTQHL